MIKRNRNLFVLFFLTAALFILAAILSLANGWNLTGKFCGTSGFFLAFAAAFQKKISGYLSVNYDEFSDQEKYPFGPPSSFVREMMIVSHPEQGWFEDKFNSLLTNPATGNALLALAAVLELPAIWL